MNAKTNDTREEPPRTWLAASGLEPEVDAELDHALQRVHKAGAMLDQRRFSQGQASPALFEELGRAVRQLHVRFKQLAAGFDHASLQQQAISWHVARAIARLELEPARSQLASIWATLREPNAGSAAPPQALDSFCEEILARRARVQELVAGIGAGTPPDRAFSSDTVAELAGQFLSGTQDLWKEARATLSDGEQSPSFGFKALYAASAVELGIERRSSDRLRGLADDLCALGFLPALAKHVRVQLVPPYGFKGNGLTDPRVRLVGFQVPEKLNLMVPEPGHGVLSELAAADALGRATALAQIAPGTPAHYAYPLAGSVGRVLGILFAQLYADPLFLSRQRGVGRPRLSTVSRQVGALLLLEHRFQAAACLARSELQEETSGEVQRRFQLRVGVSIEPSVFRFLVECPSAFPSRLAARISATALGHRLREEFDEDWFRNPRTARVIKSTASLGGRVSSEEFFCATGQSLEPSSQLDVAVSRFQELLA